MPSRPRLPFPSLLGTYSIVIFRRPTPSCTVPSALLPSVFCRLASGFWPCCVFIEYVVYVACGSRGGAPVPRARCSGSGSGTTQILRDTLPGTLYYRVLFFVCWSPAILLSLLWFGCTL
ncbi:hypothetical protein OH76DRAFT_464485 [Lentinus brumalis]|uniref:Uncharacterized protein n=1 Tax=Lentinus brumalis TaxID=2498619 RepID=A0A371DCF6_9APHY|nr:hypothetical protein OH76DRAFT_464485 [Polyporus brumalis]